MVRKHVFSLKIKLYSNDCGKRFDVCMYLFSYTMFKGHTQSETWKKNYFGYTFKKTIRKLLINI